jgi:polysaccharide chain length determinant protein (PEP-CTERM system associated)
MVRRHWLLILAFTIIGPPLGYAAAKVVPPRYVSQTMVLVQPPAVSAKIVPDIDTTTMNQELASLKQQILSRSKLEPIIRKFDLYPGQANTQSMDALVVKLQTAIEVTPVAPLPETAARDLPGFSVTVTLNDPHKAQSVCAEVTSMFIEGSAVDTTQKGTVVTSFLAQQLADAQTALNDQGAKLAAFKSKNNGTLPDDEPSNLNVLTGLNSEYDAASQALENAQRDKSFAETLLQQQLASTHTTETGQNPDTLEQQLETQRTELGNLQAMGYKDTYPDVVKAKANIAALQKQIADAATSSGAANATKAPATAESKEATALRAQINGYDEIISQKTHQQDDLQQQIKLYRARIQQSPMVEEEYTELTRGQQTAQDNYNNLLKQQNDAKMAQDLNQEQQGQYFHILDAANLPSSPTFPNKMFFTGGGLAGGLGLGLALTFLLELKDTSLKSERDVEFTLRLPVLAMILAVEPIATKKSQLPPILQAPSADAGLTLRA